MGKIFLTLSMDSKKASVYAVKTAFKKRKALLAAIEAGIDEDTCERIKYELDEAKGRLADEVLGSLSDSDVDDIEYRYFKSGSNL